MSNLPLPYNGDFPASNIDLNLWYLDNAIDVSSTPYSAIIKNYLYASNIDAGNGNELRIGESASSITIGSHGFTTTVLGMSPQNTITITDVSDGGLSILTALSSTPSFQAKGIKNGGGIAFDAADTDITINNSQTLTSVTNGGDSILSSTSFQTKGIKNGTGVTLASNDRDITINTPQVSMENSAILGESLLNSSTHPDFSTKGLVSENALLEIVETSTNITVTNTSPASTITLSNAGVLTDTRSLIASDTNPSFKLKGIKNGTGFILATTDDDVTIDIQPVSISNSAILGESLLNSSTYPNFSTKGLFSGNNLDLVISETSTDITITNASPASTITLSNAGVTPIYTLIAPATYPSLKLKGLIPGTGILITDDDYDLTFQTLLNLSDAQSTGTSLSLLSPRSDSATFIIKTLLQSTGISLGSGSLTTTITNSSPASSISLTDVGTSEKLIRTDSTNPTYFIKSLTAGSLVSLTTGTNDLTVASTIPASLSTLSIGQTLVYDGLTYKIKGITVGSGLSITSTAEDVILSSVINLTSAGISSNTLIAPDSTTTLFSTKGIVPGTGITFSQTTTDITMANSSLASTITLASGSQLAGGTTLIATTSAAPAFKLKGLSAGVGITIDGSADTDITITNSLLASSITLTSAGIASGTKNLLAASTNQTFKTKGLIASTGITIPTSPTDITITNSSPASNITAASAGTGISVLKSGTSPNFTTKGILSVGNGLTITIDTDAITLGIPSTETMALVQITTPTLVAPNGSLLSSVTTSAAYNHPLKLPPTPGASSNVLTNDGSGNSYWTTAPSIATYTTPAINIINFNSTKVPNSKKMICYNDQSTLNTIKESEIIASLDSETEYEQLFTFGPSIPKTYVAVGAATNTIAYSRDGIAWTGLGLTIFSTLGSGVVFNGNIWVALGQGTNTVAYSSDGIAWKGLGSTAPQSPFSTQGLGITWTGTKFIAVGQGTNTIAYSSDGLAWKGIGTSIFSVAGVGVAWNGKMCVAVGADATNSIAWSSDGNSWVGITAKTVFGSQGNRVAWNGKIWVAVGTTGTGGLNTIAWSSDGITWTGLGLTIFSAQGIDVAWNGSIWVAVGSGPNTIAWSRDGKTWAGLGVTTFTTTGYTVMWDGSKFIAGGAATNTLAWSRDGIVWTGLGASIFTTSARKIQLNNVRENTIKFPSKITIACGATGTGGLNTMAYSSDGITWTGLGVSGTGKSQFLTLCNSVAWNGRIWVGVGTGGNSMAWSKDGINWVGSGSPVFTTGTDVASNGSLWVASGIGSNTLAYSRDGIRWTGLSGTVFGSFGYGVAFNGIQWVAVGKGGFGAMYTIAYSSDGINWTGVPDSTTLFSTQCNGIAYGGSKWVAVGSGTNTIAYSSDGINWTAVPDSTSVFSTSGNRLAWNGALWVAVGSGTNTIAYSRDGITWTGVPNSTTVFSTSGNGVGWNGTVWSAFGSGTNTIASSSDGITWVGSGSTIFGAAGYGMSWTNSLGSVDIQQPTLAFGNGSNTIAYSRGGIVWRGLGSSVFSAEGRTAVWNGTIWVAVGSGTNTIAWSSDGIDWVGLGSTIFSTQGRGLRWNGTIWVAVGSGTNTIAWSSDGINWGGLGSTIFSTQGNDLAWNGNIWAAVGSGTNTIAWSSNGIAWTGLGTSIFSISGRAVDTSGSYFVAVGQGTNTLARSVNATSWLAMGTTVFSTVGTGIAYGGSIWVAVGQGTNYAARSSVSDGASWTGFGLNTFDAPGATAVSWNGKAFIAGGSGVNSLYISGDGEGWWRGLGNDVITGSCSGISSISREVSKNMVLPKGKKNAIDLCSDIYANGGWNNFACRIKSNALIL